VARLSSREKEKGIDQVILALRNVVKALPDAHYVVIGGGDDRPRLERLAVETGVAQHVIFLGYKTDAEVRKYYESCDIYVMPSSQEGFGLAFLEAMAFAKPVIGGCHGGTCDIVLEGVTGFLVKRGDLKSLEQTLLKLLANDKLRIEMGNAGRQRVEEFYTFERFRDRLGALLSQGIARARPAPTTNA
jgi:phosphatidyl-myo-inositol dimannoside synthase